MPQNFLRCDRDQSYLLPPDLRDWLEEDHLAWFVIEAVEELELDAFYSSYRADGHGRAAHDPAMMVTLLAYAYAVGEQSARGIERRCHEDLAFRVICANAVPDHATIARFRVRHERALAELFGQVLGLCADAGLVEVGVIALDGTKLEAMASDKATRSYEQIAAEIIAEAGRVDAAPRTSSTARRAATSCPSSWQGGRAERPGLERQSGALSANARRERSSSHASAPRGLSSVAAGSSSSGRQSARPTANTRPTASAACASAAGRRWARRQSHSSSPSDPPAGSTQPIPTRGG